MDAAVLGLSSHSVTRPVPTGQFAMAGSRAIPVAASKALLQLGRLGRLVDAGAGYGLGSRLSRRKPLSARFGRSIPELRGTAGPVAQWQI
jgi:hypothetical protein